MIRFQCKYVFLVTVLTIGIITCNNRLSHGQQLKIMPFGNSITYGENSFQSEENDPEICIGYRKALYDLLNNAGYTYDFVGSQKSGWSAGLPQHAIDSLDYTDHAGFPGRTPPELAKLLRTGRNYDNYCELPYCPQNYLAVFDPDVILMHAGTNQLESNDKAIEYRDSIINILNFIDAYENATGKTIVVFVAQILNRSSASGIPEHGPTTYFNNRLEDLVNSRAGDNLVLVDMEHIPGFDYRIDETNPYQYHMIDNLHPNPAGNALMAETWFAKMEEYNFRAPVVSNIPNVTILEGETSKTINLNNYVFDPQDTDNEITWSFSPVVPLHFTIDIVNGIATITPKSQEWIGNETITFKAQDSGHGGPPLFDTDEVIIYEEGVNDPPVITGQETITIAEDSQVEIQFSHLHADDPDDNYPGDFTLHVLAGSNYTLSGNYTVIPNSNYFGALEVPVYVNDGQENSNTFNLIVTVTSVNDKPWLNIPANRTAYEGVYFSMNITSGDIEDIEGDSIVLSAIDLPQWLSFNPSNGKLDGMPHNDHVGISSVSINVSDGQDNTDSAFSITVINTNDNPKITSVPENTLIYTNEYFQYFISAEDSDVNDILRFSAVTLPSFLTFDTTTRKLSGTPSQDNTGNHPVSLKVWDGTINIYQNFSIEVILKTHAPEITSVPRTVARVDSQYIYALKTKDIDGDGISSSIVNKPDWAAYYTNGILIGTPTMENIGFHDVVISVTDGLYTVYDSFNIKVTTGTNIPPVITGTQGSLSTPEDIPFELTLANITVDDADNIYPDDFSLVINDGDNYSVNVQNIIPEIGYKGWLDIAITVSDGTDSDDGTIPIYVGFSSVEDDNRLGKLKSFYPVPASEYINFTFDPLPENAVLTLYSCSLQSLKVIDIPGMTDNLTIDIQEIPSGIVFFRIDYEKSYDSGSFIINK